MAYYRACVRFFAWCDHHKIGEIADIEPLHVAAYVEALGKDFEKPTVKQHLAATRMLFDWLVTGQVVATNPAHSVRGPKQVVKTGKTTVKKVDVSATPRLQARTRDGNVLIYSAMTPIRFRCAGQPRSGLASLDHTIAQKPSVPTDAMTSISPPLVGACFSKAH